jgi:sugar (pentulose or hexulose) kinase
MYSVLAIDLGASGGRVIRGTWDSPARKLKLEEIHRFNNEPVDVNGTLYWDILRIFHEIKFGIRKAVQLLPAGSCLRCIGIDTWGVDFGLLDSHGQLLGNPVHYRDARATGELSRLEELLGTGFLFRKTGVQDEWFNTVGQMTGALQRNAAFFDRAEALLFVPDLLNYFFTGIKACEQSIASTSQLLASGSLSWDEEIFSRLGLPQRLMQRVLYSGTLLGPVSTGIVLELGLPPGIPLALTASHDTASAALAVPATQGRSFAFINCGTWSILGTELDGPITTEAARIGRFSNEAGYKGKTLLVKNIMGMWLLQECKRCWESAGEPLEYGELASLAEIAGEATAFINVNDQSFANPGNLPDRIRQYCQESAQPIPASRGAVLRIILESLACEFRSSLEELEEVTGSRVDELWLVGGGARNGLLCQLTASITGHAVRVGSAETTALGNVVSQFATLGIFASLQEARNAIAESFSVQTFTPSAQGQSDLQYARWQRAIGSLN